MITLHLKYNDKPIPMKLDGVVAFEPVTDVAGGESCIVHFPRVQFLVRETYDEICKIQQEALDTYFRESVALTLGRPRPVAPKRFLVLDLDGTNTKGVIKPELSSDDWRRVERGDKVAVDLNKMTIMQTNGVANFATTIPEVQ